MTLNVETLASQMLNAALPILEKDASDAASFGKTEFTKIAQTIVSIGQQLASGEINQQQATVLLQMQTTASQNVLLALKGLALVTIESAINAALGVIAGVVNKAVGFSLIAV